MKKALPFFLFLGLISLGRPRNLRQGVDRRHYEWPKYKEKYS
jgi:hypothetical protein